MVQETREDKELREAVEKIRPNDAQAILRQMERNAKKRYRGECYFCLQITDQSIPELVELCGGCLKKTAARFGSVFVVSVRNFLMGKICDWCGGGGITFHTINIKVCQKCLHRLAKRNQEHKRNQEDVYGKKKLEEYRRKRYGLPEKEAS